MKIFRVSALLPRTVDFDRIDGIGHLHADVRGNCMEIFGGTSVLSRWILTLTESTAPLAGSRRSRGTLPLILNEAGRGIIPLTLTESTAPLAGWQAQQGDSPFDFDRIDGHRWRAG